MKTKSKKLKMQEERGGEHMMKKQKGITLIALVVTIVVLIILATISIYVVLGENGIIAKAQNSKEWYNNGVISEEEAMNELFAKADEITGNGGDGGSETLVEMFKRGEIKIGDYVNYENPTSGEYIAKGTETGMQEYKDSGEDVPEEYLNQVYKVANNQLNWRVLGIDEETGGLKLIAGSPMKKETTNNNPYLHMYGAQAYVTGVEELDNICGMYKNDLAEKARSVNIADINTVTGVTTEEKIKEVNLAVNSGWKQYGETYNLTNQYTPESYLNNKTKTTLSGTVKGYWYSINNSAAPTVTITDTTVYNLLFNNVESNSGASYWLASRGDYAGSYASFGPGYVYNDSDGTIVNSAGLMFYSNVGGNLNYFAVRPVVVLRSDVTANDIQVIESKIETKWNY